MTAKHKPSAEQRKTVKAMVGYGIPQEEIATILDLDPKTLRLYYREEIDKGQTEANAQVVQSLFVNATKKMNVAAQIWWTKTRMGWKETVALTNGDDGKPLMHIFSWANADQQAGQIETKAPLTIEAETASGD